MIKMWIVKLVVWFISRKLLKATNTYNVILDRKFHITRMNNTIYYRGYRMFEFTENGISFNNSTLHILKDFCAAAYNGLYK